jgi:hypothetical protein
MGSVVKRRGAWWIAGLAFALAAMRGGAPTWSPHRLAGAATAAIEQAAARPPAPVSESYSPGQTYFGRNAYVEFRAGELPIIVSVPHGGTLEPAEMPNRSGGTRVTDMATEELARAVAAALRLRTGREPSLVVCRVKRLKLDVNRDVAEGAQGNPYAEQAWSEYHAFAGAAGALAAGRHGRALVIDLHGHGHQKPRIEIGYLLGADALERPDAQLDEPTWVQQSSIRTCAAESDLRFSALLRGPASIGGLLESAGYPSVPGPATPGPGSDPYFEGGYITRRHGSAGGGPVSAIQLETPYAGVRDSPASRARFAASLAEALVTYVSTTLRIAF